MVFVTEQTKRKMRIVHLVTRKVFTLTLNNVPYGIVMYDPDRQPAATSEYKQAQAARTEGLYF